MFVHSVRFQPRPQGSTGQQYGDGCDGNLFRMPLCVNACCTTWRLPRHDTTPPRLSLYNLNRQPIASSGGAAGAQDSAITDG